MNKTKKASFLIDLIIIIVILSIIFTIIFICFGNCIIQARDSKRDTELSYLKQKIITEYVNGKIEYNDLILSTDCTFSITNNGETYSGAVGEFNYTKIGEGNKNIKDPLSNKPYKFLYIKGGKTDKKMCCFELGSYSEKNNQTIAKGICKKYYYLLFDTGTGNSELFSNGYDLSDLIEKDS